ncbi:hypothetical protein EZS27_022765 [termite gut metagenome]|uniref:Uncharacterized protein n=1 Tax=termite gut metagenome TaxID=433724 RepID=A0A5J4R462_9ZZZZ
MDMLLSSNRIKIRAFPCRVGLSATMLFGLEYTPKSIFASIPNARADFATNFEHIFRRYLIKKTTQRKPKNPHRQT